MGTYGQSFTIRMSFFIYFPIQLDDEGFESNSPSTKASSIVSGSIANRDHVSDIDALTLKGE